MFHPLDEPTENIAQQNTMWKKSVVVFGFLYLAVFVAKKSEAETDEEALGATDEELPSENKIYLGLFYTYSFMVCFEIAWLLFLYRKHIGAFCKKWGGRAKRLEEFLLALFYRFCCKSLKTCIKNWQKRVALRRLRDAARRKAERERKAAELAARAARGEEIDEEELEEIEPTDQEVASSFCVFF